ncbi:MAG: Ig-like domain-containing protein [Candidatus Kerfeldbacteria bacterium]|nr:Ig-like domain-containing protein [Candidatus Kerfeldbacteria bacterium]
MNSTVKRILKLSGIGLAAAAALVFVWVTFLPSAEVAIAATGVGGTVQKPDGSTLAEQVNINCFGQTGGNGTMSASNGTFNLSLNPGHYKCQAQPSPSSAFAPSVEVDIDVYTDQTTTLNPRVTNAQMKGKCLKPDGVTGVRCNINVHSQDFSIFAHANADDSGNYKLGGLTSGTYVAEAQPDFNVSGLTSPEPSTVTLGSGLLEKNFTFVAAVKTITGTVKKADGSAASANVNAFRMNGQGFANSMTDGAGAFTIAVSGGSWNVQPMCAGGPGVTCDWVYQNQPTIVDFANDSTSETKTVGFSVTTASATITGTVKDKNGNAITNGNLDFRTNDGRGSNAQLGNDGSFTVKTVAGTYNVFLWTPDNKYSLSGTTVSINDNETKTLALVVASKDARIRGKVVTSSGAPAGNVDVNAFQIIRTSGPGGGPGGPGSFSNTRTLSDGTYELAVTAGLWNVHLGFGPQASFVPVNQKPLEVTVATDASVVTASDYPDLNFTVVQADATITGRVLDASNSQPVTNFFGCAFARAVGTFNESCSPIQNGTFTIKVASSVATSWEVGVHTPPNSEYSGSTPQKVTVTPNGSSQADVQLIKNNSSISGKIVDSTGFPASSCDFHGMVFADGVSGHFQGEVQKDCSYRISLVAGTYHIGTFFDPKSGAMNRPPSSEDSVYVASGQSVTKNISLVIGDATISGTCLDVNGKPLRCFVHADNNREINESRELKREGGPGPGPSSGKKEGAELGFDKKLPCGATDIPGVIKCCSDAKNKAVCEAFPVPDGPNGCKNAYSCVQICKQNPSQCEDEGRKEGPSGPQVGQDFTGPGGCKSEAECKTFCSKPENFKTCSEFKPPSGAQSVRVRSTAESGSKGPGGPAGFDNAIRSGSESDNNGKFSFKVLSGHIYQVCAGFPPESGMMPPKCASADLRTAKTATVTLQARTADATVEGKVTIDKNPAERCFVHAWAEDGGNSGAPCNPGGQYKLNVTKDTTWHICGDSFDGSKFYRCEQEESIVVTTQKKIKLDINLKEGHFEVPEPVTQTFTCTDPTTLALGNGTTISVPASAVSTDDGTCSVTATPTVDLGSTKSAQRVGVGYEVSARDEDGQQVSDLNSAITVKMVLPKDGLEAEGIEDTSAVLPAFYDSSTSSYDIKSNATVKEEDCASGQDCVSVTFTTDHLSAYTAVNASGSTSTLKTVTTSTAKNKTKFKIGSKTVTPFSKQAKGDTVTIKTKILGTQQLIVAGSTNDGTLKVYNTSGKLVKSLKTGSKGVASITLADVTRDGKNDIVVGAANDTAKALVYDVKGKYKKYTVAAGTAKAYATVATALELDGQGAFNLVTGTMGAANTTPTNVKTWKLSKGKFRTATTTLSRFIKASKGSIDLSVPKPKISSIKPTSVSSSSSSAKLVVKGDNFTRDSKVLVCSGGTTVKFNSTKQLTVTVDGTSLSVGKCDLTVENSDGKRTTKKNGITVK